MAVGQALVIEAEEVIERARVSQRLDADFIVGAIQSPQFISMSGGW